MNKRNYLLAAAMGIALCAASSAFAGSADSASATTASSSPFSNIESGVKQWWNGNSALANWGGLGYKMEDYGLKIEGEAKETFMGQISGGLPNTQKGNWVNEVKLRATYDFAKKLGIEGLTLVSNWRYRNVDGSQDSPYVAFAAGTAGPSSMFNPNKDQSGMGVRIMTQYLQWQSEAGKDPRFMAKAGWVNPYEDFLQQPDSKWFQNNAISSAKGIGGANGAGISVWSPQLARYVTYGTTAVPWSSSYAAWGGSLRAKPSASTYVQSGLYAAIGGYAGQQNSVWAPTSLYPYGADAMYQNNNIVGSIKQPQQNFNRVAVNGQPNGKTRTLFTPSTSNNHGFNFQGAGAFNPNGYAGNYTQNGLYNVNEFGWMPKLGADKLAGKYVLGGYIWGQNNTSYSGQYTYDWAQANKATAPGSYGYASSSNKKVVGMDVNNLTWGLYVQADQRLTAVHNKDAAPQPTGKNPVNSKNPVPATASTADKIRGLYMINEFSFTPPQNNAVPFYFQTGLVYKGLLDARKNDTCGVVLGAGFYSTYLNSYTQAQNRSQFNNYYNNNGSVNQANATVPNGPVNTTANQYYPGAPSSSTAGPYGAYLPNYSSTEVVEAFYNVQVNKWLTLRPDAQWINNPAGNGTVPNVWILGAEICAKF